MNSTLTSLVAYVAAASLLTITPGLDTALVLRTAAGGSSRKAALAGLGVVTGCLVWALVVALGLGALLAASKFAYTILRGGVLAMHRVQNAAISTACIRNRERK